MAPNLNTEFDIFGDTFEVGENSLPQENASSLDLPVPQSLSAVDECLSVDKSCTATTGPLSCEDKDLFADVGLAEYVPPEHPLVTQPRSPNLWPPTLIIDLAMGLEHTDEILTKYGMTQQEFERLKEVPSFRRELSSQIREQNENGLTFAKKAAAQAETYLFTLDEIVNDPKVPASTRLATVQAIAKWGGLEPKDSNVGAISGNTINLQINYTS